MDMSGLSELRAVLRFRAFRRLWIVLGFSSIGDWLGILAAGTFAASLFKNPTAQGAAFSGTIVVRLIPALVLGPVAGVFADRFDRRRTMVICDAARFLLWASIPVVGIFTGKYLTASWAAIAIFLIETCQMMWAPAKEASVPNLVPRARLEKANQLGMATTYGITPILAGVLLAFLNWLIGSLGFGSSYSVALFLNALTYAATALMVWFGIREISGRRDRRPDRPSQGMFRQFLDGWRYVARFSFARGLVLGILGAFAAAGVVIGTGRFYAKSLGGGDASFFLLFALLFVGLGIGIVGGPRLVGALSRRRWFGLSIILATAAVALLAVAPHLFLAAGLTVVVGAGAGMAFLNGITLLGAEIDDSMRGRVYSFIQVAVQGVLLLTLSVSSVLVGLGSSHRLDLGPVSVSVSATRLLLFAAGVVGVFAGYTALRQMDDKRGVPLLADVWSSMRGRPLGHAEEPPGHGVFVVFEGGEGAGKSTQVIKLAAWLRIRGREAVVTREPGATEVGARIRGLVLDRDTLPADARVSPRAEALLYAADRAHHVATVVRPALRKGAIVVSDRYVDSSLAYQGAGRTLPAEEVGWLSRWATGGLKPDLVVLLDVEPEVGLRRVANRGAADRLESESLAFHERVRHAFLDLAAADPQRYLVVDASAAPDEIAERVRERVARLLPAPDQPAKAPSAPDGPRAAAAIAAEAADRARVRAPSGPRALTGPDAGSAEPSGSGSPAPVGRARPGTADPGTEPDPDMDVPGGSLPAPDHRNEPRPPGRDGWPDATWRTGPAVDGQPSGGEGDPPAAATGSSESAEQTGTERTVTETRIMPVVTDGREPRATDGTEPRTTGERDTAVLPSLGEEVPGQQLAVPADPWRATVETTVFPTVEGHDPRDSFDDDETMIMPSRSGDVRRRKPGRRAR